MISRIYRISLVAELRFSVRHEVCYIATELGLSGAFGPGNKLKASKKEKIMTASLHVEMHADHTHWNSETSLWDDDIGNWQMEINKALGELDYLKSALQEHGKALQASRPS